MRIAMIGAGYVGLVSAACFSEFGSEVVCVEADASRLAALRAGDIPFFEPGLSRLVKRNFEAGRLSFSEDIRDAAGARIVFLAVGTPRQARTGQADLGALEAAVRQVSGVLVPGRLSLIVTKSTVPVGTARRVEAIVLDERPDLVPGQDFDIASNPEFLREGSAIEDFLRPDRVVLGIQTDLAWEMLSELYGTLSLGDVPFLRTDRETAELIKYATNGFLAAKITFINEMADLCEQVGANVADVARGLGMDGRIGPKFLHPGPGYGGSCLPKDTSALAAAGREHGAPLRIVEAVVKANEERRLRVADRVSAAVGGDVRGRLVAVLGLTFKPETDDMREAVSRDVVPELLRRGARVRVYDPVANAVAARLPEFAGAEFSSDAESALEQADALLLLTEWNEFRGIDPASIRRLMSDPVVIDMRNVFHPQAMREAGIRYRGVGVP